MSNKCKKSNLVQLSPFYICALQCIHNCLVMREKTVDSGKKFRSYQYTTTIYIRSLNIWSLEFDSSLKLWTNARIALFEDLVKYILILILILIDKNKKIKYSKDQITLLSYEAIILLTWTVLIWLNRKNNRTGPSVLYL